MHHWGSYAGPAATKRHRTPEKRRRDVIYTPATSDLEFDSWLAQNPTEDALRTAYLNLEARRADLWTPGHHDSFRRDRYELDSRYIRALRRIKQALVDHWTTTGQVDPRTDAVASA